MLSFQFHADVCQDCLMWLVNGDDSGASDEWNKSECDKTLTDWAKDGVTFLPDFDGNTQRGISEFSSGACDVCASALAGSRHRFAAFKDVTLPISDDNAREVIRGYQVCAQWLATDDDGEPCDHCELASEAIGELAQDCISFLEGMAAHGQAYLLEQYKLACPAIDNADLWQRFGHDFFLTRNGHGAGFWDRGYGALGETLSELARAEGGKDLFFNDDTNEIEVL